MSTEVHENTDPVYHLGTRVSRVNCKNPQSNPYYILGKLEEGSCQRFCTECNTLRPSDDFAPERQQNLQHFICRVHKVDQKKQELEKKRSEKVQPIQPVTSAALSLRNRVRNDMPTFGQSILRLTLQQTKDLLRQEHVDCYGEFSIIPVKPHEPVSPHNAIVVPASHRRYLTGLWRQKHDPDAYERDLKLLLEHHDAPRPRI